MTLLALAACGGGGGGGGTVVPPPTAAFTLMSSPDSQTCGFVRLTQPIVFVFSHSLDPASFYQQGCDCYEPAPSFSTTFVSNDTVTLTPPYTWQSTNTAFSIKDTAGTAYDVAPALTLLDDASTPFFVNAATGDDGNSGTDPSAPFATLQAGVNAAYAAVQSGTYSPARQVVLVAEVLTLVPGSLAPDDLPGYDNSGDPGQPVVTMQSQVSLCGGFSASSWLVRDPATHETRIVSVSSQADQTTNYGDTVLTPVAAVASPAAVSGGTVLDGFTLVGPSTTAGAPSNAIQGPHYAAALWTQGNGTIRNTKVYGGRNRCWGDCAGATRTGILVGNTGSPEIISVTFSSFPGTSVSNEYGLYVDVNAQGNVEGNTFSGSSANTNYAIYSLGSPTITSNVAIHGGSGNYSYGIYSAGNDTIENNPLIDGGNGKFGSYGIYTDTGSQSYIVYNTAVQGGSGQYSYGVYVRDGSPSLGFNSVLGATGSGSGGGILGGSGSIASYGIYVGGGSPSIGGAYCSGCNDLNLIDGGSGFDSYGIYIAGGTPTVYWHGYQTTTVAISGGSGSNSSTGIHIEGGTPDIEYNGIISGGTSPTASAALEDHGTGTILYQEVFIGGRGAHSTGIFAGGTDLSMSGLAVSGGSGSTSSVGISIGAAATGTVIENNLVSGCGHYGGANPGACTGVADYGTSTVLANNTIFAGSGTDSLNGNLGIDESNTQTASTVAVLWNNLVFTNGGAKDACIAVRDATTLTFTSLQHNGGFQCGAGTFTVGGVAIAAGDATQVTADGTHALGDAASLGNAFLTATPAAVFHTPGSDPGQIEVANATWWKASYDVPATGWALLPSAPANVLAGGMDLSAAGSPHYTDLLTNGASYPSFPAFGYDLTAGYPRCKLSLVSGNLVTPTNGGQYWSLGAYMSAYGSGPCFATQ